jgi:membrane protease YdiL (CAAX protease family)
MVFGLYHLVNLTAISVTFVIIQFIYATAIGVSFAIVFYISKSILPCIVIHALTDIISFLLVDNVKFEIESIGIVVTILIAVFYIILYSKFSKGIVK